MYVVRPQFFIPMITVLRNAALNALTYKAELALVRAQSIDITSFEDDLDAFKSAFGKNYDLATDVFRRPSTRSPRRSSTCKRPGIRCWAPIATCASQTTRRKRSRSQS
jgi:hypothetical protein